MARDKNMLKEDFLPRVLGIVGARRGLTAFGIDPDTVGFAQLLLERKLGATMASTIMYGATA
jgi:hypothetical protein